MSGSDSGRARVVDAHHHVWDPRVSPQDYSWLSGPYAAIDRVFTPEDLRPELAAAGVDATVLVQTRSSLAESREFLRLAARTDFIRGVVAWLDLTGCRVGDTVEELALTAPGHERLVGIRHQVHNEPDPEWLSRSDVCHGLGAVERADLVYDLLVRTRELPSALKVVRALPHLRFVIDHLAKPPIANRRTDEWAGLLEPFGALENVSCKISGMVTEADHAAWTVADLRPYVDRALEIFGPQRLMFGSDWPVCLVAASYGDVVAAARELIAKLSSSEQAAIMGGTATRVYKLR